MKYKLMIIYLNLRTNFYEFYNIGYKEYVLTANGFKLIYDPSIFVTKEYAEKTFTKYVN